MLKTEPLAMVAIGGMEGVAEEAGLFLQKTSGPPHDKTQPIRQRFVPCTFDDLKIFFHLICHSEAQAKNPMRSFTSFRMTFNCYPLALV